MKTFIKRFISTFLASLFVFIISSFAASPSQESINRSIDSVNKFSDFIKVIYTSPNEYRILNSDGINITAKFADQTRAAYMKKNYYSVYDEFLKNGQSIVRIQEISTANQKERDAMDIQKTVITRAFIPVYYNKEVNVAFNIYIEGKNIFYYDPNTYRITRYNDPLLQTIDFMGAPGDPRIENDVSNATLQYDGINVKYEYRYGLSIDTTLGGRIDIGYYGTNFILNGESPNIIDRN